MNSCAIPSGQDGIFNPTEDGQNICVKMQIQVTRTIYI